MSFTITALFANKSSYCKFLKQNLKAFLVFYIDLRKTLFTLPLVFTLYVWNADHSIPVDALLYYTGFIIGMLINIIIGILYFGGVKTVADVMKLLAGQFEELLTLVKKSTGAVEKVVYNLLDEIIAIFAKIRNGAKNIKPFLDEILEILSVFLIKVKMSDFKEIIDYLRFHRRQEACEKSNCRIAAKVDLEYTIVGIPHEDDLLFVDKLELENADLYKKVDQEIVGNLYILDQNNQLLYYIRQFETSNLFRRIPLELSTDWESLDPDDLKMIALDAEPVFYYDFQNQIIIQPYLEAATVFPDNFAYKPSDVAGEGSYLFDFKDYEGYDLGLSDLFLRSIMSSSVQNISELVRKTVTFTKDIKPGLVCLLPRIEIKATTYTLNYAYYERGISLSDVALSLDFKSYGAMAEFLNQTIFYTLDDIDNFIDDDPTTSSSRELFIEDYVYYLNSHLRFGNYNQMMEVLYFVPLFLFKKIDINFLWDILTRLLENAVTNSGPKVEDIVIRILKGLAESSQSKYIFLSELINRKTKNKTSLLYKVFYRIDGENFVTFVKFLWKLWKESTFIFPAPATNPIYSKTDGSLFLPYQSDKTIGFYFTSLKVKEISNTELAITYETGEYETYTGKDAGGGTTTKSRKVMQTASYHPYYPIYLVKTDQQDFVFDDLKHETLVPAFVLYANELKTFWSNVVTTGEYTVDILTTLSGVGNIAKFRHLTKLNKLAQVAKGVDGIEKVVKASNILRYIKGAAGVVELTSGSLNLLLKITDLRNESPYKELSHFLFYLELLTLAGELTASLKVGLKKSAREAIEKSDGVFRKQYDELFEELYKVAGLKKIYQHVDDFMLTRSKFQDVNLVNKLWEEKIVSKLLYPSNLRKLYFKYLDKYPNLRRGFNQAEFKTTIFNQGKKMDEILEFSLSGDKSKLTEYFGNAPDLPENTIDVLNDYDNFEAFVNGAKDFNNQARNYDSEIKYIFNFLKNHIDKGDKFVIQTQNIFKTCGSCRREFVMLEDYLKFRGKKVKFVVFSDETIEKTAHLKKILKIK